MAKNFEGCFLSVDGPHVEVLVETFKSMGEHTATFNHRSIGSIQAKILGAVGNTIRGKLDCEEPARGKHFVGLFDPIHRMYTLQMVDV